MGGIVSALAFPAPAKEISQAALLARAAKQQLVYLKTASGYQIPAIHLVKKTNSKKDNNSNYFTIIYSHGNAEDVGLSLPYLDYLSQYCDCHVFAYEYCGYSLAEGEPSEQNCYECIQAAYDYLTNQEKVDSSKIVLVGRSLGTGPTVDLAAKLCIQKMPPAGVVLQSPLESGGRCVLGESASFYLYYLDIFRNYEKIHKLAPIPVFIMHGLLDRVVPATNGKALLESLAKAQRAYPGDNGRERSDDHYKAVAYPPLWIPDAGHNDMPEFDCMQNIAKFLRFLNERKDAS
ncbi:serine aminopeptidase, S33 [Nitzschia inconspicua]|uniref:Serine aminopeptidase, S33 n=1 Tax=Nitzschia inconspicua TaxID=303405 RepID=A0A9K3KI02_9STRA|nr:serine aminopeptidase, S33 [Nitzschia inconspicua]